MAQKKLDALATQYGGLLLEKKLTTDFIEGLCVETDQLVSGLPREMATTFWDALIRKSVSVPQVVATLQRLLEKQQPASTKMSAAKLYLNLLKTPGSSHFSVFDALLYRNVLSLLKVWISNNDMCGVVAKKKPSASSKQSQPEDTSSERTEVGVHEGLPHILVMVNFLEQAFEFLSFNNNKEMLAYSVEVLCCATRFTFNQETTRSKNSKTDATTVEKLHRAAYKALFALASPTQTSGITSMVLKGLLPNLLMTFVNAKGSTSISKPVKAVREASIGFVQEFTKAKRSEQALFVLLQHMCLGVPEKAEYRTLACDSVIELMAFLPIKYRCSFVDFINLLSKNQKMAFRQFSVDLAGKLLELEVKSHILSQTEALVDDDLMDIEQPEGLEGTSEADTKKAPHESSTVSLIRILYERSSDKFPAVRSKALSVLATLLESEEARVQFKTEISKVLFQNNPQPGQSDFVSVMKRRVDDEKSTVRKSALQLLSIVGRFSELQSDSPASNEPSAEYLQQIKDRCRDSAVSIRKQSMVSLSELFNTFPNSVHMIKTWASVVPALVQDTEQTVSEKAIELFDSIVVQRVLKAPRVASWDPMLWFLLIQLNHGSDVQQACKRICERLFSKGVIQKKVVTALSQAISADNAPEAQKHGAWILLSFVAPHVASSIPPALVVDTWNKDAAAQTPYYLQMLSVLGCVAGRIGKEKSDIQKDLVKQLSAFSVSTASIQAYVQVLIKLSGDRSVIQEWASKLLGTRDCHFGERLTPSGVCTEQIEACVMPVIMSLTEEETKKQRKSFPVPTPTQFDRFLFTVGELVQVASQYIPVALINVVQTLVAPSFTSFELSVPNADGVVSPNMVKVPASTRAHAFLVLGKLCLTDQALATKCITAFAHELESSPFPVVRNNVMVIMCDLAKRYTSLVDRYVVKIATCLKDESELVRRQTLMMLTHLMQEDYIKWNSVGTSLLFYRFIISLTDESAQIREYAHCCLVSILNKKLAGGSNIFYNNFLETIFVLNDYRTHGTYNVFNQTAKERELFSLKGSQNHTKRMSIYNLFLKYMKDDQKFNLQSRLVHEILESASEGILTLTEGGYVILDALVILASKEIKMRMTQLEKGGGVDNFADDEAEQQAVLATGKLLSKIQRKNLAENLMPVVVELKHFLSLRHSPLLRYLMDYLKEIMVDYKNEVQDILMCDPQLAEEIQYDLRQHSKQHVANKTKGPLEPQAVVSLTPAKPQLLFASKSNPATPSAFVVPKLRASDLRRLSQTPYKPSPAKSPAPPTAPTESTESFPVPTTPHRRNQQAVTASPALFRMKNSTATIQSFSDSTKRRWSVGENSQTPQKQTRPRVLSTPVAAKPPMISSSEKENQENVDIEESTREFKKLKLDFQQDVVLQTEQDDDDVPLSPVAPVQRGRKSKPSRVLEQPVTKKRKSAPRKVTRK